MKRLSRRWLGTFLFLGTCCARTEAAELPSPLGGFMQSHCMECHDTETKKGGLDLSALPLTQLADRPTFDEWVKIHDRVTAGEMPPAKKTPPPQDERDAMLKTLGGILSTADKKQQHEVGRVPLRRMNRTEYENT